MKSAHFAGLSIAVCLLLIMAQPALSVQQGNQQQSSNAGKQHSPRQKSMQIIDLIEKLKSGTSNMSCPEKDLLIEQLKKELQAEREKNKNLEANLKQVQLNLLNTQKELIKTQSQLRECRAQRVCPSVECPTITCPEQKECQKCQICKPCPQFKEKICPSIQCPPKIVCPAQKPCNCEVCKQPTPCEVCKQPSPCEVCKQPNPCQVCKQPIPCPSPKPCPQKICPEAKPCPVPTNCDAQTLKITTLTQKIKTLQSNYDSVLQQRDNCLRDDSGSKCQQQLSNLKGHLTAQLTKFVQKIQDTLFRSGQKLNFDDTKVILNEIKAEIQSNTSWADSLAAYRKISLKILTQLDSVSSLTSEALELNNKYSSGIKSLRDKLARCESLLR